MDAPSVPRVTSRGVWIPRPLRECECLAKNDPSKGPGSRVDPGAGVIRGVKIISRESSNSRRYDCLQQAARLYEGVSVRVNHQPGDSDADRDAGDVLGELRNVKSRPDGLYGDLHLLTSHPMAKRVMEAAQRMPRAYGLSHNVTDWDGHYEGGTYVVTAIREVESVDLVADPATTKGLFESQDRRRKHARKGGRMRLKEWLRKQRPEVRREVRRLVEAGAMDGGMLLGDSAGPEASIKSAFLAAATAVLGDDALDAAAALPKLKAILKARDDLMASGAITPEAGPADAPTEAAPIDDEPTDLDAMGDEPMDDEPLDDLGDEDDDLDSLEEGSDLEPEEDEEEEELTEAEGEDSTFAAKIRGGDDYEEDEEEEERPRESRRKPAKTARPAAKAASAESGETARLREEVRQLKAERHVRALCESMRVAAPSKPMLKALMALSDDNERRQLLRESRRSRPATSRDKTPLAEALTREEEPEE